MKPENHIAHESDGCYWAEVETALANNRYIGVKVSKRDIGHLLQGKHIILLFLNDDYEDKGMVDIKLSDDETVFEVSEELNQMMINT